MYNVFETITEVVFFYPQDDTDITVKVGAPFRGIMVKEIRPLYSTNGDILLIKLINTSGNLFGCMPIYGVPCLINGIETNR
jgi:hypothetical protein